MIYNSEYTLSLTIIYNKSLTYSTLVLSSGEVGTTQEDFRGRGDERKPLREARGIFARETRERACAQKKNTRSQVYCSMHHIP